ncbi:MAG: hypothetical protein U5K38_13770 [Woeseiaceae bacterium]|nr:hypothetical protein [Woeseiaceae bacterium]
MAQLKADPGAEKVIVTEPRILDDDLPIAAFLGENGIDVNNLYGRSAARSPIV